MMRRHRFTITALLAGIALWPASGQPAAAAASLTLDETEKADAIQVGRKSVIGDDFGGEWRATDGVGQTVRVMTPYHRLALAARNAAFRKQELKPREIDSLMKESQGKLALWVTLRGPRPDFARFLEPVLLGGPDELKASFVQNERTALREEDGRFAARCLYVFPAEGLSPRGRVTLVVRDPDSRELAKFVVDLSAMR